jgi:hypothetical protein
MGRSQIKREEHMTIEAMKAIQMVYANTTKHDWPDDIWDAICQAVESEKQSDSVEPVAWSTAIGKYAHVKWGKARPEYPVRYEIPLYTHTQPKREPLTDEQILALWEDTYVQRGSTGIEFARAIEAAHGIKENP